MCIYKATDTDHMIRLSEDNECVPTRNMDKRLSEGDVISFGHYYSEMAGSSPIRSLLSQLKTGKKLKDDAIEWLVLKVKDGKALLISRYGFQVRKLKKQWDYHLWKESPYRRWLHDDFLVKAFSKEEQSKILSFDTDEDETEDRISFLSITDARQYFDTDEERTCSPDPHSDKMQPFGCWWYLRSPGRFKQSPAYITCFGEIGRGNLISLLTGIGLRPVMWIDLRS